MEICFVNLSRMALAVFLVAGPLAVPVAAQDNSPKQETEAARETVRKDEEEGQDPRQKKDDTVDRAGRIVTQPARDVGVVKTEIPEALVDVVEKPYDTSKVRTCKLISDELAELNAVLGPDFGVGRKENEDKVAMVAEAGGRAIINSLIPFRGLVREVSGSAAAERRRDAAVAAGFARRGFLRGIHVNKGCKTPT